MKFSLLRQYMLSACAALAAVWLGAAEPGRAQSAGQWFPDGAVDCKVTGADDVDFGIMPLLPDATQHFPFKLQIDCRSNAYPLPYTQKDHIAEAAYCLVISGKPPYILTGSYETGISLNFYSAAYPAIPLQDGRGIVQWKNMPTGESNSPVPPGYDAALNKRIISMTADMTAELHQPKGWGEKDTRYDMPFDMLLFSGAAKKSGDYPADIRQGCSAFPGKAKREQMHIYVQVKEACHITAEQNINFEAVPDYRLASALAARGELSLACSKGLNYTVGISMGDHAQDGMRAMKREKGEETINYQICKDSGCSLPWSDRDSEKLSGKFNSSHAVLLPVYARTLPNQGGKPAGVYRDRLVVILNYNK